MENKSAKPRNTVLINDLIRKIPLSVTTVLGNMRAGNKIVELENRIGPLGYWHLISFGQR